MTTLAPVLDLVGDIGHFSAFVYGGARWVLYIRETGALELHRSLDGITAWWSLDVPFPKTQVTACVLGDELCIAWTQRTTEEIYFSRWHLDLHAYIQAPTLLWAGASPALAVYETTKLVLAYRNSGGQHVSRTSGDSGGTWSAIRTVDPAGISEVDVSVYPASDNRVYWDETSDQDDI